MRRRFLAPLFACLALFPLASLTACSAKDDKGGSPDNLGDSGGFQLDGTADSNDPRFDVSGDVPIDPDGACASKTVSGKRAPLTIAIVFDQSSSMSDSGKIGTAKAGIEKAFGDPKFDDVAASLFRFGYQKPCPSCPFGLPDSCAFDTEPYAGPALLATGRKDLFAKIDALTPQGSTPTFAALNAAYAWLAGKIIAKAIDGKVAVVLVTDGVPTCGSDTADEYVALVAKGRKATIDTFIIGLPGSGDIYADDPAKPHSTAMLSKMAAAGTDLVNLPPGCATDPKPMTSAVTNPCYFNLDKTLSIDALSTALENIRKAVSSCEYSMPTASALYDMENPSVLVTDGAGVSKEIPKCVDPGSPPAAGCWDWADTGHTRIKLYGAACTTVKSSESSKVDILLKCKVR